MCQWMNVACGTFQPPRGLAMGRCLVLHNTFSPVTMWRAVWGYWAVWLQVEEPVHLGAVIQR